VPFEGRVVGHHAPPAFPPAASADWAAPSLCSYPTQGHAPGGEVGRGLAMEEWSSGPVAREGLAAK
jgi:hypothetical protein